ncbi:PQQ-dependent sugar dehydrogenase [Kribbia dieselivorans]|uniref:PQQ-dependent sugar dehydrogenase n=1 Tax=Kribbia dieselivorans TaxID=331526 RepID=UPI0008393AB1|nr:PQQ-dependent sugar dehydrogenase [Kribbia dieselivorans]
MRRLRLMSLVMVAAVGLAGCTGGGGSTGPGGSTESSSSTSPTTRSSATSSSMPTGPDGRPFAVEERATFDDPWALTTLPGTPWLAVTQRSGTLHLVNAHTGDVRDVTGAPEVVADGQGGLGDIIPAPGFSRNRQVYLSWIEAGDGGTGAVVGRGRLNLDGDASLSDLQVIWRQDPKQSGSGHFSHRLAISPDEKYLFVTSGDRQKFDPAQDLTNNLGSIVRLTLDGQPAPGNPFADRGGLSAQIWSYGHRNPLGLAFDDDGRLWSTEMGPQGGDELNLIARGANYGWPRASNGSHYGGADIPDHAAGDGFTAPKVFWTPSVSPSSLMIYSGKQFPAWRGDAFIGALSGTALIRVDLDGENATAADEWDMGERIREVEQGRDGSIWLLEDTPGGRLLHLTPPRSAS